MRDPRGILIISPLKLDQILYIMSPFTMYAYIYIYGPLPPVYRKLTFSVMLASYVHGPPVDEGEIAHVFCFR